MLQHEVSEGFIRKPTASATNYQMYLVIDGQKKQKSSGTSDPDEAIEKLAEWRAEERAGVQQDSRLRYEQLRDDYLEAGKKIQESILRDLDTFFKGMRISAIEGNLSKFRKWRESLDRVVEYREEMVQKEITLRKTR